MSRVEQTIPERVARTTSLPGPVRRSLEVCREVTRTRAGSFYLALRLTPEPRRSAMYALYAWSRLADDIADETPGEAAILKGLERLARDTKAAFNNVPAGDDSTLWPGVCWAFRDFGIKPQWCEDLIEGMRREAAGVALTSMSQFDDYCYRVAGTVGLMCMSVWGVRQGVRPDAWIEPAKARGRALQTINVLRDFAPDFDRSPRRVYVPTEILSKCGLVADGLREWRDDVRCRAVVAELVGHARRNLESSAVLAEMVDPACFGVLDGMTRVYEGLLRRIEANPRAIVGASPVRLSTAAKSMIACGAYLRGWRARLGVPNAKGSRA